MNFTKLRLRLKQSVVLGWMLLMVSCGSGGRSASVKSLFGSNFVDRVAFKAVIQSKLPVIDESDNHFQTMLLADSIGLLNAAYAYKLNGYEPIWVDESGFKPFALPYIETLRALDEDGLDTGKYAIARLEAAITSLKAQNKPSLDAVANLDKELTALWMLASKDILMGTSTIKKTDSLWFAANDTLFNGAALLTASIKEHDALPSPDSFQSRVKEYVEMKAALKLWRTLNQDAIYKAAKANLTATATDSLIRCIIGKELPKVTIVTSDSLSARQQAVQTYQYYHQLAATGLLDSGTLSCLRQMPDYYITHLKLNMDRLRALPRDIQGEYIWVAIPSMEVNYYKKDQVLFHSKVVVGKLVRQTPSLWADMENVVFNPPWGVPPTILKHDIGPGVGRSGGAYLRRKGLHAFNAQGRDVTYSVNGSNYKRFSYRQPPGARNLLGEVKFNLPNPWNIYLHDTPHRDNFSHVFRALSSGCVRVQYPKLLAEVILNDQRFTADKIDTIIATRKTTSEKLNRRLAVYIIYATIAQDSTGSQLRYLKDVYGRDEKMISSY